MQELETSRKLFSNLKKKLKLVIRELLKLVEEEDIQHPATVVNECHLACIQAAQALISRHLQELSKLRQQSLEQESTVLEPMERVKVKA